MTASSGLLGGCEAGDTWQPDRTGVAVSAEQRDAAKALSLFSGTQPGNASDYGEAVDCTAAVNLLNSRIGGSGLASEADLQAIRKAEQVFEARAFKLAGAEEKTRGQATSDLTAAKAKAAARPAEAARSAIGCINRLASPS